MTNALISVGQFVFCTVFFSGLIAVLLFGYESKRPTNDEMRWKFIIKISYVVGTTLTAIWFLRAFRFI